MREHRRLHAAILFAVISALSAQAQTVVIDADFQNGSLNSNGSFEFDGTGVDLTPPPPAGIDTVGLWTSGDVSSLSGIARPIDQTRTWGTTTDGDLAIAIGRQSGQRNGTILNTGYVVQLSDANQFSLSFDWTGSSAAGGWEIDDDLEVALFTSSDNTLSGTLTQIWSGAYLDGNGNDTFESISVTGVGNVTAASAGQELFIVFSAGLAGAGSDDELAILDNVRLSVSPPSAPSSVVITGSKPDTGVLAQSDPDGTSLLAFDAEESASNVRYAWGQSFTVPAGQSWELSTISAQHHDNNLADADARIKLAIFDFNTSTFDSDTWGTYSDPFNGAATNVRYTEEFTFTTSPGVGDWISFELGTAQALPAGDYGFALWLSNPAGGSTTGGALTLKNGGTFNGGQRLRVRDTGNTLPGSDLNFVLSRTDRSTQILQTSFASAVESPEGTITDTPQFLLADFGTEVTSYITRGRGTNGTEADTGIRAINGDNAIGGTARIIDDLSGVQANNLAQALAVANDPNGTPLPDSTGMFAEFTLDSTTDTAYNLTSISFTNANTTSSGSAWGIALLHDGDGNGYDVGDELGRLIGTFSADSNGQTVSIPLVQIAALQEVVDPVFRFYFWEDFHGTSAFNHEFGVSDLIVEGIPASILPTSLTSASSTVSLGSSVDLTATFDATATSAVLTNDTDATMIDLIALDDGDGVVMVPVSPTTATTYTATAVVDGYTLADSTTVGITELLGDVEAVSIGESGGVFTIAVSSSDFRNDEDHGVFAAQSNLSGDFHLETEVVSLDGGIYPWAKAGIMARTTNDRGSRSAGVYFTEGRGATFQSRKYENGESRRVVEDSLGSSGWVRLIRIGDSLHGAASSDGSKWTSLGAQDLEGMPASLLTGIGVAGQNGESVSAQVASITERSIATETGIYGLTLVDDGAATYLRSFFQGEVVDLDYYQDGLSVRAEVASSMVASVVFRVDGTPVATDSSAPFNFDLSTLANGPHTLEAVPYDAVGGTGNALDSLCADFHVNRGSGATPPNLIYIHCDDLGYGDTGFNGSQYVFTPELDKLAESGLRCTAGYVTAPQCGPSRAGMVSGMYQVRFNYDDNGGREGLPDKAVAKLAPELLQDLGYTNAMIGKWHIGVAEDSGTSDFEDRFVGILAGNHTSVMPWFRGFDYTYAMDGGSCHYSPYSVAGQDWNTTRNYEHRNLEVLEGSTTPNYLDLPADTYQTTEFTARAIDFIDRNKSGPFFVYLSYNAPHTPLGPTAAELAANSHLPAGAVRNLAAAMTGVDREVGRLVDYLDAENLLENTIIMFFSDNGGPTASNASINDPFSGFKGDALEGGTRVPFLISWKGQIPENRDFHDRVFSIDYITTILHQQRRSIPDHLDGLPLLEDLQGKASRLANAPRFVHWRSNYRSVHLGHYKRLTQPSNSISGAQDAAIDLSNNITEDPTAPALDPSIVADLDQRLADFNAEVQDADNQAYWFDPTDSDTDGILDSTELRKAGNLDTLGDGGSDADGDGTSDTDELKLGTDPLDRSESFNLLTPPTGDDAVQGLSWLGKGWRVYQIERSLDLTPGSWGLLGPPISADGQDGPIEVQLPREGQPRSFYRVELVE